MTYLIRQFKAGKMILVSVLFALVINSTCIYLRNQFRTY